MTTSRDSLTPPLQLDPRQRQSGEALSDTLAEAPDLQSGLQAALPHLLLALEAGERRAGDFGAAIVIQRVEDPHAQAVVVHNLPESWASALTQARSPLRRVAARVVVRGEILDRHAISGLIIGETVPIPQLCLALPLRFKSSVQGVLLLAGPDPSAADQAELERLVSPLGRALWNARKTHVVQQQAQRFVELQQQIIRLSFGAHLEELHEKLIEGISLVLEAESAALVLLDRESESIVIRRTMFEGLEWAHTIELEASQGLITECLHTQRTLRIADVNLDPRFNSAFDAPQNLVVGAFLCAPLVVRDETLGALVALNKRSGTFNAYDQDLLTMIAGVAAQAIYGTLLIQEHKIANADLEASHWELLHSRNTLRALFDSMPAALYIINRQYQLVAVNLFCADRTAQKPRDLVNKPCYRALYGRSEPCPGCRVFETLTTGQLTARHDQRWFSEDEPTEWEISTYPIRDENEEIVQAIVLEQDVTEKRRLESILAQSEKLAAVGQLAAGVAHEINNPLTAIVANAQILQRELPPDTDIQESVELIARAGARAAQVVRNLLDFARRETYHLAPTDVNETLRRALALIQHELLIRSIQLNFQPAESLPPILASQDHLQGVWLNLLLNAIDALEHEGGKLEVSTLLSAGMIQITITDTGKGISPERLERIFEPFYTTKAPGRGTGLGLSVVHRVIKQHGGHIMVKSEMGVGTEFTIVLPVAED